MLDLIDWKRRSYIGIFSNCSRIAMWGAGGRGTEILSEIDEIGYLRNIVGIIDSDPEKQGRLIKGIPIYAPNEIPVLNPDGVIISSYYEQEILRQLNSRAFPLHRIYRSSEWNETIIENAANAGWVPDLRWKSNPSASLAARNFLRFLSNFEHRRYRVDHYPFYLNIEPSQKCNLRCPVCPKLGRPKKGAMMNKSTFIRIIDKLGPYLYYLHLYRKGESFTNKNFIKMLRYAREKSSAIIYLSSNFSFRFSQNELKQILLSTDYIGVCLDGMSPKTYNQYRIGGCFESVCDNLLNLSELSRELKANCKIAWRFIVFRHNEHEVPAAMEFAQKNNLDIEFVKAVVPDTSWLPQEKRYWRNIYLEPQHYHSSPTERQPNQRICMWLYGATNIGSDGVVYPCCEFKPDWGNFDRYDIDDPLVSFNSIEYRIARGEGGLSLGEHGRHCLSCPPAIHQTSEDLAMHCRSVQDFLSRNPQLIDFESLTDPPKDFCKGA